jgi:opacity protein-like surface antigen
MRRTPYLSFLAVLFGLAQALPAQSLFNFDFGAGFTNPVYDAGRTLNTGWNFTAGAGISPVSSLGVMGEFNYNYLGMNDATLRRQQVPGGDVEVWSFTVDPIFRFNAEGRVSPYVIVGGGIYHRVVEYTAPVLVTSGYFDPFFGIFFPITYPANVVISSFSVTKPGFNGGAGVSFRIGQSRAKFYMEARYHHMYTSPQATSYVPVTFGIRW